LLAHARRAGLLPEEYRPHIFNVKRPHTDPTFLVDGVVAGQWRYEDGAITRTPFRTLDKADERALDDEAARLLALHS
ncbi:MAG TPA: crosslink repair DNA glycosylase YcaQ family protein, partial [Solirubrobacteraceae bacterium]